MSGYSTYLPVLPVVAAIVVSCASADLVPGNLAALQKAQSALQALELVPADERCDCHSFTDSINKERLQDMVRHIGDCVAGKEDINEFPYLDILTGLSYHLPKGQAEAALRALLEAGVRAGVQEMLDLRMGALASAGTVRLLVSAGAKPTEKAMCTAYRLDYPPEVMKALIDAGANPYTIYELDNEPLICACIKGLDKHREGMVLVLLQAGVDANTKDAEGKPLLALARTPELVRALLAAGADPKAVDAQGDNVLFAGPGHRPAATIRCLIEAGVDYRARNHSGDSMLRVAAAMYDDADVVRLLLELGMDPNATDASDTHLLYSVNLGEVAEILLAAGAKFDTKARPYGSVVGYFADEYRTRNDILRVLAAAGADFSFVHDPRKMKALNQQSKLCLRLLDFLAAKDPAAKAEARDAALRLCLPYLEKLAKTKSPMPEQDRAFLRELADKIDALATGAISGRDYPFIPAFCRMHALRRDIPAEKVDTYLFMLREAGADINAKDAAGRTGLHYVASSNPYNSKVAWSLISLGADVNAKDSDGNPPLFYAQDDIARVLRSYGAEPTATPPQTSKQE